MFIDTTELRLRALGLCLLGLLVVMLFAIVFGSTHIGLADVATALWHGLTNDVQGTTDVIIVKIRLPRVILAAVVGASLAVAGLSYQAIFQNPLAEPYLLGVASGASLGATLALIFASSSGLLALVGVPLSAFVFALLGVALVIYLARQGRELPLVPLILAGAVLGSSFSAISSFVMMMNREQAAGVLSWLMGSFAMASWPKIFSVLPFFLLCFAVVLACYRGLNMLLLGEEQAVQLGLSVNRFKILLIVLATLATAAAVSVSGIIGFVGLLIPHAARMAFGPNHLNLIPLSAMLGASFLILADLVARTLIAPAEIPIGVVTSLVGGPFFLYLLKRFQRTSDA